MTFTFLIFLLLFAASIPTATFHWENRVNLCLISEDGALGGIMDQCALLCVICDVSTDFCDTGGLLWMELGRMIHLYISFHL